APAANPTPKESAPARPAEDQVVKSTPGFSGSLTRGELDVRDFEVDWPLIRDKIVALGGKVAGNVRLGWLGRRGESYFHISLPESNFKELEQYLETFGPVRFSNERHPRVMPQGQIRIILSVKDSTP